MQYRQILIGCMLYLLLATGPTSQAFAASPVTTTALPLDCELHVFPPKAFTVVDATQSGMDLGLVGNGIAGLFRIKDPRAIEQLLQVAAPIDRQLEFLHSIDYTQTKKGRGRKVVFHDHEAPILGLKEFKTSARSAQSTSTCYSEIVFSGTYFEKSTMHQSMKSSYFYRDYGAANVPKTARFAAEGVGISHFPPKTEAEIEASKADVWTAVRQNIMAILNK